jgi:hypothetical protein
MPDTGRKTRAMADDTSDTSTTDDSADDQTTTTQLDTSDDVAALKAEAAKWQALAQKHEARAKGNAQAAKDLEAIRAQSMSELERAVAEAQAATRREVQAEFAGQLVDAEIKAAAAGRLDDKRLDVLLQGVNRAAFLDDEFAVDLSSIRALVDAVAPPVKEDTNPLSGFDLGQGARSGQPPSLGDDNELVRHVMQRIGGPRR